MIYKTLKLIFKTLYVFIFRKLQISCDGIPVAIDKLPLKKIINWLIVELAVYLKFKKAFGFPTHLQVEVSSLCNLKCRFCPVSTGLERETGLMSLDIFKKIIDETGEYVFLILLWNWGEPFLNKDIFDMIKYAKNKNIKVITSTNGIYLYNYDKAEQLVGTGIDGIIFSIDGLTHKTYEQYRCEGDFEKAVAGLKNVVRAKRKLNAEKPVVNLQFIPMKHNEHEIKYLKDFAEDCGADTLTIRKLSADIDIESETAISKGRKYNPVERDYQRFSYDKKGQPVRSENNLCKRLWNNPVIQWDGKVSICCFDPNNEYVTGGIVEENFSKIWFGDKFDLLRKKFREDYKKIDCCRNCTNAYIGGMLNNETVMYLPISRI